jgi:hypothetical protein
MIIIIKLWTTERTALTTLPRDSTRSHIRCLNIQTPWALGSWNALTAHLQTCATWFDVKSRTVPVPRKAVGWTLNYITVPH